MNIVWVDPMEKRSTEKGRERRSRPPKKDKEGGRRSIAHRSSYFEEEKNRDRVFVSFVFVFLLFVWIWSHERQRRDERRNGLLSIHPSIHWLVVRVGELRMDPKHQKKGHTLTHTPPSSSSSPCSPCSSWPHCAVRPFFASPCFHRVLTIIGYKIQGAK